MMTENTMQMSWILQPTRSRICLSTGIYADTLVKQFVHQEITDFKSTNKIN